MTTYSEMTAEHINLRVYGGRSPIESVALSRASFQSCHVGLSSDKKERAVFRDISLSKCKHGASFIHGAVLERVVITDLTGGGRVPTFLWGCLYSQVILKGPISGLMFRWQVASDDERLSREFVEQAASYYKSVPFALDITEAKFTTFDALLGIPPSLIKRDVETQFVLLRERIEAIKNAGQSTIWRIVAQSLNLSPLPGVVIVLGKRDTKHALHLKEAQTLRAMGILQ